MIEVRTDNSDKNSQYVRVGNIRITYLEECSWVPKSPGLRIQAYRNDENELLHKGAEIPIENQQVAFQLIEAIAALFSQNLSE